MEKPHRIVPDQHVGSQSNNEYTARCKTLKEATELYHKARKHLLQVNDWQLYAGKGSASFRVTNAKGAVVTRPPQPGDYIRIDLPAPPLKRGHGFDWVKVELLEDETEQGVNSIGMRVRPARDPQNPSAETAHFFKTDATSSFVVMQQDTQVKAGIYGRNEVPNVTGSLFDKIRNLFVGGGAALGISRGQWKKLAKGIICK